MNQSPISQEHIEQIQRLAQGLMYGTISLVFQNGQLLQIEKSEKIRVK